MLSARGRTIFNALLYSFGMNKSMYLGVIAGIIIVGGVFWWMSMRGNSSPKDEVTTNAYGTDVNQNPDGANGQATNNATETTNQPQPTTNTTSMNPTVTLQTTKGNITIELDAAHAPITVANFVKLAESGFYDGVKFHRVIKGFMDQAGDPLTKDDSAKARWGTGGPGYTIADEFQNGLVNTRGTIAMANTGAPHSSGSQFFINAVDNAFLNGGYTVFGKVTAGLDVVDAINNTPTAAGDVPTTPITITKVVVAK